jgi:hypothetical protein
MKDHSRVKRKIYFFSVVVELHREISTKKGHNYMKTLIIVDEKIDYCS